MGNADASQAVLASRPRTSRTPIPLHHRPADQEVRPTSGNGWSQHDQMPTFREGKRPNQRSNRGLNTEPPASTAPEHQVAWIKQGAGRERKLTLASLPTSSAQNKKPEGQIQHLD